MQDKTLNDLLESDVGKRVIAVVSKKFGVHEALSADANFFHDFGADSIDVVELLMELEEEFKIEIPANESENIVTIEQAILYINSHT